MDLNLPNGLTLFRIALIPLMVISFYLPFPGMHIVTTTLFVIGALTDWLDGYIARKLGQISAFGTFLDPVADKLSVTAALFLIVQSHSEAPWMIILAMIIVGREITISALREWMAEIGERAKIKVITLGKTKTIMQMTAISFLLLQENFLGIPVDIIGKTLLFVAVILTVWSATIYVRTAWPLMHQKAP